MGAKNGAKKEEKAAKPTQITVILRLGQEAILYTWLSACCRSF